MRYVADGFIKTDAKMSIADRLAVIHNTLNEVLALYRPDEAAIEQVFLNDNPTSTIKLGMARGVVILAPSLFGITVTEYEPNKIKKPWSGLEKPLKIRWKRWLRSYCRAVVRRITIRPMRWPLPFAILTTEE